MKTTKFQVVLAVSFMVLASSAKADQFENLSFNGNATCLDTDCSSFGSGTVTGTYTLDVTTQQVVGAWSFSTPFGLLSSTQLGAEALVDANPPAGFEQENAYFQVNTGVPGGFDFVWLFFPNTDLSQTGPIDATTSTLCFPDSNSTEVSCTFVGYTLTGSNVTTPEPSTTTLLGPGLVGLMGIWLYKKRLAYSTDWTPSSRLGRRISLWAIFARRSVPRLLPGRVAHPSF